MKCARTIDDFNIDLYNKLEIGVEIQDFTEPNLTQKESIKLIDRYKKLFKNFTGLKALHGPFLDLKPASPDPLIRQASRKRYLDTLYTGSQLDIDYIVFHSQINPYLNHPDIISLNNRQTRDFWHSTLEEVKHFKGIILLENIFEEEPYNLRKHIESIAMDNVKINLDIGHAKLGKVSLETWIKELKDHIGYMHIHSNDGKYDSHKRMTGEEIDNLYEILDKYVDVTFGEFEVTNNGYFPVTSLDVTVKNKADKQYTYFITIEAIDSNGARIETDTVYADRLGSGQEIYLKVFEYIDQEKLDQFESASFRVLEINKYSS